MKKLVLFLLILQTIGAFAQTTVQHLRCENLTNPIGLDITQPRFSWQLASANRNVKQTAYEIRLGLDAKALAKSPLWSTGQVMADSSVHVAYKGAALQSGKRYFWQVRVWDNTSGKPSAWSTPAFFQMALLQTTDWKAQWISPGFQEDTILRPSPMFRKEFTIRKPIRSATAYITSHGMYVSQLNGERVGDAFLTPGWTSYKKRLQYQTYDVGNLLRQGANAIGVTLGNGWYRGYIGFSGQNNYYGKDIALLYQLDITYQDGTTETIVSDASWKSSTGPIRSSEIYNGEIYDARLVKQGWNKPGFADANWSGVTVQNYPKNVLVATYNEPVRKKETFNPVRILRTPKGEQVVDFGQNLVGWVLIRANGKAGDSIKVYHAEVLDKYGNFYTENLRAAKCQNTYILNGKPDGGFEKFEPHFTWQGFQYVKIEGFPGELKPENIMAISLYSDMQPTGQFTSSNALINQLQHNIQWGQRGNFLDVPTDCPQRDERLGWTGDAQAFSRTAAFNFNVNNFFAKWLKDVAADQLANGSVPFVVPNVLGVGATGSAGWADVATIAPWNMYLAYGDKRILEQQYPSMKAWVGYMQKQSKVDEKGLPLWNTGFHFGDWLFYRPFDDNDGRAAVTDKYLIAQCFFAHSTQLLINTARVLGKTEDVKTYSALLQQIKDAFRKEYMTPSGRLVSGTQTAYVLALNFDMLPENLRQSTAQRLVDNIKSYGNHLTTGFLGTPYLCHVLSRFGYNDVAYSLLHQETYPSWLYPVKRGATTIWERWDGIKPDSTFQTPSMNSYNHYAYGAIGDWMYRVAVGLDTEEDGPGYHKICIRPHVGGKLTQAAADLQTYYGRTLAGWKIENGKLIMDVDIPANTTATIYVPASQPDAIQESGKPLNASGDIQVLGTENGYVTLKVGSGKYQFTALR